MGVHFQLVVGFLDLRHERLQILVGVALAGQNGAGIGVLGLHLAEQRQHRAVDGIVHRLDGAVGDADDVSLGDGVALGVLGVAGPK